MYPRSGFRSGGTSAKTTLFENHPFVTPDIGVAVGTATAQGSRLRSKRLAVRWQSYCKAMARMEEQQQQQQLVMEQASSLRSARASQWKIREIRRKEARDMDKCRIQRLTQRIEVLEGALACWQHWYLMLKGEDRRPAQGSRTEEDGDDDNDDDDAALNCKQKVEYSIEEQPQQQLHQADGYTLSASPIDYSRWDHIGEDEDGEEEDAGGKPEDDYEDAYWGLDGAEEDFGAEYLEDDEDFGAECPEDDDDDDDDDDEPDTTEAQAQQERSHHGAG